MNLRIINDITNFIFISDKPQKADIIFIPGGSLAELPEYAAKLYKEGYSDKIMPSGKYSVKVGEFSGVKTKQDIYDKHYETECDFFTDVLTKNGVPMNAIHEENKAQYTIQNAKLSRMLADEMGLEINKAIIICKSFHARRCLMLYQLAFPKTEFIICTVDCYCITSESWHKTVEGIERVFGELSRCGNQFVDDIKEVLS